MEQATEEARTNFYKTFNKTEKSVLEDIEIIKEWLKTQKHLPEIMGDNHIRNFLHQNKFSIETTKVKIDMYYTMRTLIPEFFPNPNEEKLQKYLENTEFGFWPKLQDGIDRITFAKSGSPVQMTEFCGLYTAAYEVRLNEEFMGRDIYVIDWANLKFSDLSELSPTTFTKLFNIYQKIYSTRMRALYYINSPSFFSTILNILKNILKPKIFNRVIVCSGTEILSELMPKNELPKDYGGNGPSLKELTEKTKEKFKEYSERFTCLENMKVDEALRPEKLNNDEVLGFHGNFKKIDVD